MKKGVRILLKTLAVPVGIIIAFFLVIFILQGIEELKRQNTVRRVQQLQKQSVPQKPQKPQEPQKPMNENFVYAVSGEVWIIQEDNIGLTDVPQNFRDKDQFKAHLNCIIMSGTKVEILKHKIIGSWKYVRTLDGTYRSGWTSGYTVKKCKKVS